ncbi:MAG: ABC transporter permease [Chloroflexi bacterium]|nr:ABC transporter permease [Chloroflexota bacterium]
MSTYIIRRLIYSVLIAWGVLTITFILLRVSPNSPVDKYIANIAARGTDVAQVTAAIEARYGLDKPIHEQYFEYVSNLVQGNWGWSLSTSMPVMKLFQKHWVYSFQIVVLAFIAGATLGISLGIFSAVRRKSIIDHITTFFSFVGISVPTFWLGVMLILVFSVKAGWFRTYYDTSIPVISLANLKQLILPEITLITGMIAGYSRYARSGVLDNLHKEFVRTARSKGLGERAVLLRHVFRNSMLPIVTIIMGEIGGLVFATAYFTEIIFGIPGLGQISFNAILANDYSVVISVVLIGSLIVLLTNLATDIAYTWVDPRIRYS